MALFLDAPGRPDLVRFLNLEMTIMALVNMVVALGIATAMFHDTSVPPLWGELG